MTRVSQVSTDQEFEAENRREALRDRRVKRYCLMILSIGLAISLARSGIHLPFPFSLF